MEEIFIRDDMIRLGQFLKLANLVEDGAQAREVIQHGLVKVNGDIEEARGKQLHPGDTVTLTVNSGGQEKEVQVTLGDDSASQKAKQEQQSQEQSMNGYSLEDLFGRQR